MKSIRKMMKVWFVLAMLAAVVVAIAVSDNGLSGHVYIGDDVVDGPAAIVIAALAGAVGVFVAGMILTALFVGAALIVPLVILAVLMVVLLPVAAVVAVVLAAVAILFSPFLLLFGACVLLVRIISRKPPTRSAATASS